MSATIPSESDFKVPQKEHSWNDSTNFHRGETSTAAGRQILLTVERFCTTVSEIDLYRFKRFALATSLGGLRWPTAFLRKFYLPQILWLLEWARRIFSKMSPQKKSKFTPILDKLLCRKKKCIQKKKFLKIHIDTQRS